MATLITKNSSTASAVPAAGDLVKGELAVNVTDKKVYTKDNSAAVVKLVGSLGNQEANAVAITGGTINGTTIGATTPSTGAFTTASASSGFTGNLTGNVTGNVSGTAANVTGVVAIANGGTGLSALGTGVQSALGQAVTGSGSFVLSTSPSLTTPNLGTPSAAVLTNATGLPLTTGVTGTLGVANGGTGITAFGTGVATALGQNVTGSGGIVLATSPSLTTPNLGTPSAATLTNATGLPISTGVSGLGTGVATALGVATGSAGAFVVNGGALGTPSSGTLTNATGLPLSTGVTGTLAVANGGTGQTTANAAFNALAPSQTGNSGKYLTTDGTNTSWATNPLGTVTSVAMTVPSFLSVSGSPITSSGTLAVSLSGTALPTANGGTGLTSFTANGVVYASSSSALATGSALTFDGTNLTVPAEVYRTSDTSYLRLSGGNGPGTGANVLAFGTTHATAPGRLSLTATGTGQIQSYSAGGDHVWSIVSEQMRLTSTGLGIGTSSPSQKLTVAGGVASTTAISALAASTAFFDFNSGSARFAAVSGTTGTAAPILFSQYSSNGSVGRDAMTLSSDGNLGLGVTPSAWSNTRAFQVGSFGALSCDTATDGNVTLSWNAYATGSSSWLYRAGGAALRYTQDGSHKWYTAPSGTAGNAISFTQAMTLDASGRLLVGVTSGYYALDVGDVSGGNMFRFTRSGVELSSFISGGTPFFGTTSNTALALMTNNTERARITSDGNLLVGKTSSDTGVVGAALLPTATAGFIGSFTSDGQRAVIANRLTSDGDLYSMRRSGTEVGTISVTTTATAYNTSSDYRLKDNPQPLTGSGAFIDALKPKSWTWKADGSKGVGFIAHEVQEVSPASVVGEKDGEQMQAMEYGSAEFIANIIAELQSLRARLAAAGI